MCIIYPNFEPTGSATICRSHNFHGPGSGRFGRPALRLRLRLRSCDVATDYVSNVEYIGNIYIMSIHIYVYIYIYIYDIYIYTYIIIYIYMVNVVYILY